MCELLIYSVTLLTWDVIVIVMFINIHKDQGPNICIKLGPTFVNMALGKIKQCTWMTYQNFTCRPRWWLGWPHVNMSLPMKGYRQIVQSTSVTLHHTVRARTMGRRKNPIPEGVNFTAFKNYFSECVVPNFVGLCSAEVLNPTRIINCVSKKRFAFDQCIFSCK